VIGGLLLALLSAAAINLGFLLQHRALHATRAVAGRAAVAREMLRSRSWLGGQALGWAGFGAQIVAVSIAPLALVQSFAAGGLALSVPLAAGLFHHRVSRRQSTAVVLAAAGLAVLPLGLVTTADRLQPGRLTISVAIAVAAAFALAGTRRAPLLAIGAGLLYGVADAAIKAVSINWGLVGSSALLSVWVVLAAAGTFAGFLAFQAALRLGGAVSGISLMNCFAALVALACGLLAFGESLGASPAASVAHVLALGVVFACTPVLAGAHSEIADGLQPGRRVEPSRDRPGERAADREPHHLEPWTQPGAARPHHVAQP
jgi:hypothetical protein